MPDSIPIKNPIAPATIGIHEITLRTADGKRDRAVIGGSVLQPGTLVVDCRPMEWRTDGSAGLDLDPILIQDAAAWLAALAADPATADYAGPAATRFGRVADDLLWLLRLRLSASGVCDPPSL